VTDLAYVAPVGSSPSTVGSTEYIPGDVVRQLVAWSERDIEMLRAELELLLKDAEAIEQRLALLDPGASRINWLNGHQAQPVATPAVIPVGAAAWRPQNEWTVSDLTAAVPTVSEPIGIMPAVPAPTVSDPTIAMPAVPAPTVSDPTIAIPVVPASPAAPSFAPPPVSDPTAIVPSVNGSTTWEPAVSEPIGGPSSSPSAAGPPTSGRTGRTTVVYRPPLSAVPSGPDAPVVEDGPDPDPNIAAAAGPATRREIVRGRGQGGSMGNLFRGRWMMKAGMIIAVMGIVFLKFG
jgi:hypothetical protein